MNKISARVLILKNVPLFFTYDVTGFTVTVGMMVNLDFGKQRCEGLVCEIFSTPLDSPPLKSIVAILPEFMTIPQTMLSFLDWFVGFYHVSPYIAYKTIFSLHLSKITRKKNPLKDFSLESPLLLSGLQQDAMNKLADFSNNGFSETLLHGVTASGKTEIYLQLSQLLLSRGKTLIVLVPEISLTPQFTTRFEKRFGSLVGVIHSSLTPVQRLNIWRACLVGEIKIIIGARSAIFSPLQNLGAIIIDEAHDNSYKQDRHPRYWTHDIAKYRAEISEALLVYGTATPNVDMLYAALNNQMNYVEMPSRILDGKLPPIILVDMKLQSNEDFIISTPLKLAIESTLLRKEKIMILLNRRGYSTYVACSYCARIHICPDCHLGVTYHQNRSYQCHRCGTQMAFTVKCNFCAKPGLRLQGLGIQKLEWEIKRYFPQAQLLRLDRDTGSTAQKTEKIIQAFKDHGDILIGTQMIAKGHDIPEVTLVGVIGIDASLNLPDYSAPESTFQLITQVAGRAGRGQNLGTVYVQSLQPEHYAITCASKHDVHAFYSAELQFRKSLNYPPFSKLMTLIFSDPLKNIAINQANNFSTYLNSYILESLDPASVQLLGPRSAPIEFTKGYYRQQIVIKVSPEFFESLKQYVFILLESFKKTRIVFDFNPRTLL